MRPVEESLLRSKLGVFLRCWTEAAAVVFRPGPLAAMLPLLLAELGFVAMQAAFPAPPWGAILEPAYRAIAGRASLHYPESWAYMAGVFAPIDRVIWLLAGSLSFSLAVSILPAVFLGDPTRGSGAFGRGLRRWPAAFGASVPILLVAGVARYGVELLPPPPPGGRAIFELFAMMGNVSDAAVRVLLAYGVAAAVLESSGPIRAIGSGIRFASRHFWTTAGFVILAGIPAAFVRQWRGDPGEHFATEAPEMAGVWLGIEVFLRWIGFALLVATTTRLWLHRRGPGGAGDPGSRGDDS